MRRRQMAVKICGLTRREDATRAAELGVSYAGVVLAPGGKRAMTVRSAAEILKDLPVRKVGVFVDADAAEVAAAAREIGLDAVQLHGAESPEMIGVLRELGPYEIWKAIRVRSSKDLLEGISCFSNSVDALLLDGWSPAARGGTGTAFPWEEVLIERDRVPAGIRLVVGGGLTPENVGLAIRLLSPDVVDVSSGVELSPGIKDPGRMSAFLAAASLNQPS